MKKVFIFIILILLAYEKSFCGEPTVIIRDFNRDGYEDRLERFYDGGSSFGGNFVSLTDGKTREKYNYNSWGSFGQFLLLIPFDNRLLKSENKGFKEAIEEALFPDIRHGSIENSLGWLINAYLTTQMRPSNELFSQKISFKLSWTEGKIVVPSSYYFVTSDEKLFKRYPIYQEDNPKYDQHHGQGWLVYYAHNHRGLELVQFSDIFKVFKTAHGVILSRGDQYCWVFINDEILTDGPPKLRWPSIKKVVISNELVFIHHMGGEEHLFIVDYSKGIVGRLKGDKFSGENSDFEIRNNQLTIRVGSKIEKMDLERVRSNLK
jgi:hypothetical protein